MLCDNILFVFFFFVEKLRTCQSTLSALPLLVRELVFSGPWNLGWSCLWMEIGFKLESGFGLELV